MGCANSKKDVDVVKSGNDDPKQQETCTAPSMKAKTEPAVVTPEVVQAAAPSDGGTIKECATDEMNAVDPPSVPRQEADDSSANAATSAATAHAVGADEARVEAVAVSIETAEQSIDAERGAATKIQACHRGRRERKRQASVSRESVMSVKQLIARGNSFTSDAALPMPSSHDRERATSMTGRGSHAPTTPPRSPSVTSTVSSVPVSPAIVATGGGSSGPPSPIASDGSEDEEKAPTGARGSTANGAMDREGQAVARKAIEQALMQDAAARKTEAKAQKAAERVAKSAFGKSLSTVSVEGGRQAVSMVAHFVPEAAPSIAATPSPAKASTPGGRGHGSSKRDERLTGESVAAASDAAEGEVDGDNEWLAAHLSLTRSMSSHGKQVRSASKGKKKGSKRGSGHGARPSPPALAAGA